MIDIIVRGALRGCSFGCPGDLGNLFNLFDPRVCSYESTASRSLESVEDNIEILLVFGNYPRNIPSKKYASLNIKSKQNKRTDQNRSPNCYLYTPPKEIKLFTSVLSLS